MADSQDELVSAFCSVTGVSPEEAIENLSAANWDNNLALATYFQNQESDHEQEQGGSSAAGAAAPTTVDPGYTGPRTLDGRPAPASSGYASSSAAKKPQQKKKGLMTMSSLRSGHDHDHDHDHNDEDDDEDEDDHGRGDLFAGGEKSGLAVHDPKMGAPTDAQKLIRGILARAKANHEREPGPAAEPSSSRSWGAGHTLGGEGVESRDIPDPSGRPTAGAPRPGHAVASEEVQERVLHIWQDGFSIDDGPLHRFDDPSNAADLAMIRQGRAPLHLMNVQFGQAVDVKLHQHEEAWHQLPRVYRPFSGEGRRLGSPTSAATAPSAPISGAVPAAATTATTAAASSTTTPTIDESQPTLTIRVALPDGTRLPARFNTTQTIGDVYEFVQRALPASQTAGRSWVLATFPSKEHTDRSLVLGETAEFKRGGAAMVKWV